MSGGSMDYIYIKVEEASGMCEDAELAELLSDAAKVLHDEEWWRSADCTEDEYRESLAEFKAKWFEGDRADRLKGYVEEELEQCRKQCYSIIGYDYKLQTCDMTKSRSRLRAEAVERLNALGKYPRASDIQWGLFGSGKDNMPPDKLRDELVALLTDDVSNHKGEDDECNRRTVLQMP